MDGQLMPDVERGTPRIFAGRYQVERMIARGGMGEVYLCTDLDLRRPVALKILRAGVDVDDGGRFSERFRLEARTLATLNHANIVTLYEYGETDDGQLFLALEYIDGPRFTDVVRQGPMDPGRVLRLAVQVCRALRFAHRRGVVHRDLKPSNLLIRVDEDGEEQIKVVDFGLVKVVEEDQALTRAGLILGSPHCMAPEQIRGLKEVDHRADIYAVGVLMFRALVGKWPFHGETSTATMIAHINQPAPTFAVANPDVVVQANLEALVQRCLEKDPANRYPDVAALMVDLREITGQPATVTHSSLPVTPSTTEASIITPRVVPANPRVSAPEITASAASGGLNPQFKWIGMGVGLSLLLLSMVVLAFMIGHYTDAGGITEVQGDALMPASRPADDVAPADAALQPVDVEAPSGAGADDAEAVPTTDDPTAGAEASGSELPPSEAAKPEPAAVSKPKPKPSGARKSQPTDSAAAAKKSEASATTPSSSPPEAPADEGGSGDSTEAPTAPSKLENPDEVPDVDDIFGQ